MGTVGVIAFLEATGSFFQSRRKITELNIVLCLMLAGGEFDLRPAGLRGIKMNTPLNSLRLKKNDGTDTSLIAYTARFVLIVKRGFAPAV